ncbi:hypothetical protein ISCGN_021613 [Ixodes scapularis]
MQDLNRRSASGPDRVSNKALRNLNDAAVTALTAYFNKCWRAGKLPRQWKEAKTILIPKPGKSPDIENLRPVSLTSCVGKLLEHILMTRWQQYLEEAELYPDSLVGFRSKLGTQDAMLQLKKEIVRRGDSKALIGRKRLRVSTRPSPHLLSSLPRGNARMPVGNQSALNEEVRNLLEATPRHQRSSRQEASGMK